MNEWEKLSLAAKKFGKSASQISESIKMCIEMQRVLNLPKPKSKFHR